MKFLTANIKWIMIISGGLTCTMLYAAIAPQAALQSTFGETLEGPLAEIIVRNWGILITLVGVLLIYGGFSPPTRPIALAVAGLSKAAFITLILMHGGQYLSRAGLVVAVDSVWVIVFALYFLDGRRGHGAVTATSRPD